MRQTLRAAVAGAVAVATLWGGESAAVASSNDVIAEGSCSQGSTWKLKGGLDNGRLEVEFEVDSNVVGQTWGVRLSDNGTVFFRGIRETVAPSGSFEVRRFTANQAGTDTIVGAARNPDTGEVCRGTITI
ncbi:MAG: hypothetical protein ABR518_08140 [Actinomycetota bacterium]